MNTILIMDIIITILGLLLVFITLKMKKTGEIHSMILAKEEIDRCKDQAGFIAYISSTLIIFGIGLVIAGTLGLLGDFKVVSIPYYSQIELGVFLGVFALFVVKLRKAREQFVK